VVDGRLLPLLVGIRWLVRVGSLGSPELGLLLDRRAFLEVLPFRDDVGLLLSESAA
jgi:hypothetical protein